MPQIIVMARPGAKANGPDVMFTERVSCQDFESRHFQNQLVERLSWAVGDAQAVEQNREPIADDGDSEWTDEVADIAPRDGRDRQPITDAQPAS